jgi:hypothetical protein
LPPVLLLLVPPPLPPVPSFGVHAGAAAMAAIPARKNIARRMPYLRVTKPRAGS